MTKQQQLDEVASEIASNKSLPLRDGTKNDVPGEGDADADKGGKASLRKAVFWYSPEVKRHVKASWKLVHGGFSGPDGEVQLVSYKLN